jgi:hypothetical protein
MQTAYEMTHDGPYLRIVLPDCVPSNWEALRREVEFECGEPITRATIVSPHVHTGAEVDELHRLVRHLEGSGADVFVAWRTE